MNLNFKWLLPVCATLLCSYASAQEKYTEVRIPTPTKTARDFVFNNLELDHYKSDKESITVVLNSTELERLKRSGYAFTTVVDDVIKRSREINAQEALNPPGTERLPIQSGSCQKVANIFTTPAAFGVGGSVKNGGSASGPGYFTYAEMITKMNDLVTAYPGLVSIYNMGTSDGGLAMWGVKISDNVATDENEPEVLFTGLQHAREAIGGTSLIFYMQYLLENYATNPRIKELVDSREIFIIPCLNPDGYTYNYTGSNAGGGGLWRKNRRATGGGASNIGVDINRNYGVDWGNCSGATASCGSNVKTDETYYGTSAFSEPETQALRTFVYNHHFVTAIDQHCYGPYYSLPYGRPSLHPVLNHVDSSFYKYIPALMGFYNGHRAGNSPETVNYEVAGGIKDWLLMGDIGAGTYPKTKIYGMTGEAGGGDFWAPVSQIIQLCKENCFQNIQLAYAAGDYYDLQDQNDIAVTSTSGNFDFAVRRVGLTASSITVSIDPIENIQSVGSPIILSIGTYYDSLNRKISYTLPSSISAGQRIRFAWKLVAGGITILDTVTKFYNPLTLLSDDMEGTFATNWTGTIAPTGPTGWGFVSNEAYAGSKSMTESPGGNYTVSSTRTVKYNNTFNLSDANNVYLSFWTRYRAENFRDKLQVQVSTNGTTFVPVCGTNMVSEDNTTNGGSLGGQPALTGIRDVWSRELFDLSAYKGNASVSLRFVFTSDNDASAFDFELDDGFYIDNLKVIKTPLAILGVKFVNFYAKPVNNTVQLDWEAYTDEHHAYFEVEKSSAANGTFTSFAKVAGLPPYRAFDLSPSEGNNYYRIKQVDKDGHVTYSSVINVFFAAGKMSTIIYPNPVKNTLSVKIVNSIKNDDIVLKLTNSTGQVVAQQPASLRSRDTEIKMDLSRLPAQVYFLKITNSNHETISTEKIIKQ